VAQPELCPYMLTATLCLSPCLHAQRGRGASEKLQQLMGPGPEPLCHDLTELAGEHEVKNMRSNYGPGCHNWSISGRLESDQYRLIPNCDKAAAAAKEWQRTDLRCLARSASSTAAIVGLKDKLRVAELLEVPHVKLS
jgi:hypothetical protein